MKLKTQIKDLKKEIEKSKKCKMCIQLNEDFGTDCPKHMKLQATLLAKQEDLKLFEEFVEKLKKGRHYKTNYWELFYPDGTSSLMNFDPLKQQQEILKGFIKDILEVNHKKSGIKNNPEKRNGYWVAMKRMESIINKLSGRAFGTHPNAIGSVVRKEVLG